MVESDPSHSLDLRQGVRIPVKTRTESVPVEPEEPPVSGEEPVISSKLLGRLHSFKHMLQLANEEAAHIEANNPHQFGAVNKEGKVINKYMDLDPRFVYTINHTAWNMYEDEFAQNPEAVQAANEILREQKEPKDDGVKTMTPEQLDELFQRE